MRLDSPRPLRRLEGSLNAQTNSPVHEFPLWQRIAVWPFATVVRLWCMSVRVSIPPEDKHMMLTRPGATLFVLWHNRLFMAAELQRRLGPNRKLFALISASKDGAWLAAFFSACGIHSVRGSSTRMGREAVNSLIDALRDGSDAGITPDGPRGPAYVMKPGPLVLARRVAVITVIAGMDFEAAWRLSSWDGFYVPMPFSRMHVRMQRVDEAVMADKDGGAQKLTAALAAINPDRIPAPVRKRA